MQPVWHIRDRHMVGQGIKGQVRVAGILDGKHPAIAAQVDAIALQKFRSQLVAAEVQGDRQSAVTCKCPVDFVLYINNHFEHCRGVVVAVV